MLSPIRSVGPLLALALLLAPAARAAEPAPELDSHTRTAARTLASQGTEAFESKEYERALDLFRRAGSLVPAPTIALMEARTLAELGRWVEAVDIYAGLQKAQRDAENPAFRQAADDAARESDALMPRIPRLKLTLPKGAGLQVRLDGRLLPPVLVGVDNPLDPGVHRVEVFREHGTPRVYDVTLAEREHRELAIEFPIVEVAPAPVPPPPAPVPPPVVVETRPSRVSVPAVVAFSAGGAGLVFGAVTGIVALGKKSDLDAVCDPTLGCPPNMTDTLSSYRTTRTLSYVGLGLGLAGVAVGTYFVLSAPSESGTVGIGVSPSALFVKGTF